MKRILLIASIILSIATVSNAQVARPSEGGDKSVKLYPNPATTYITFDFQKSYEKGLSLQVFNFLGRKMYETQTVTEKTTLDLNEYNRGVYIYHIRDYSGRIVESGKFQVSK